MYSTFILQHITIIYKKTTKLIKPHFDEPWCSHALREILSWPLGHKQVLESMMFLFTALIFMDWFVYQEKGSVMSASVQLPDIPLASSEVKATQPLHRADY